LGFKGDPGLTPFWVFPKKGPPLLEKPFNFPTNWVLGGGVKKSWRRRRESPSKNIIGGGP